MADRQADKHPYYTINFFLGVKLMFAHQLYRTRHIGKFIIILLFSLLLLPFQCINKIYYNVRLRHYQLSHDPVFIIGHWRSGTSFLHHLLAQDQQWGIVNGFYAFFPGLEIFNHNIVRKLIKQVMIKKRPQDKMPRSVDVPEEEEFALTNISKFGVYHSLWLPKENDYFNRFCLFKTTQQNIEKWKKKYLLLLKKYAYLNNSRQLLLKNPVNTARIKVLLELFPNAKFIYIHRNPVETYCSMVNMYEKAIKPQFLQDFDKRQIEAKTVSWYILVQKSFNEQKSLIKEGNLVEVKFEELVKKSQITIKQIYTQLRISLSENAQKKINTYLDSVKDYRQNTYHLSKEERNKILTLLK
ncbi:MAG: sulfotransferase [Bacteroidales bacterium]|nr:sulfotransferase [Bacteroidales bacterium]